MMKFALFLGCTIPARLEQYESASRAVLGKLGVELVDIKAFNCCGYPLRNVDFKAFALASARNLALAESEGLDVLALCQCCYGSLKKADHLIKENGELKDELNEALKRDGLRYSGEIEVLHLLQVLSKEIGIDAIREKVEIPFEGLKIATHYGCHLLRPSKVVQFDDPIAPTIFDTLIESTGAESVDWERKLECCGAPVWGVNDDLSKDLMTRKLDDGRAAGADYICTACPYCQIQFDTVQDAILQADGGSPPLPAVVYPQLLGLSMGIDRSVLGLDGNRLSIDGIVDRLSNPNKNEEAEAATPPNKVNSTGEPDGT